MGVMAMGETSLARIPVKLDRFGRVLIPASIRNSIGAKEGDTLIIEIIEVRKKKSKSKKS